MAGYSLTETEILDQLWSLRERTLLQRISVFHNLDYNDLLSTFGTETSKKVVQLNIKPILGNPEVVEKPKKSLRTNVPEGERCMARVWNSGKGGRCTRRGCKGPGKDLCGNHARCFSEKGVLPQGRMDEELPENMASSVNSSPLSKESSPKENILPMNSEDIDSKVLDEALQDMIDPLPAHIKEMQVEEDHDVVKDTPVEVDIPGEEVAAGKKKRGRPKGRKNTKPKDSEILSDLGEEILEEDNLNSCVSEDDISMCLKEYLEGSSLSDVTVSTAKRAIEKKLNIISKDYNRTWFKETFNSLKSSWEELQKQVEIANSAKVDGKEEEVEEIDENDSDSEEVACQEITVGGKNYLLDPETMKVYAREAPNGFVGKYDGSEIDFDAEDSDADSDDEE